MSNLPVEFGVLNAAFVARLHEALEQGTASVSEPWRSYLARLDGDAGQRDDHPPVGPHPAATLAHRVESLARAYRAYGHLSAAIDPLGRLRGPHPELDPGRHGLSDADLDTELTVGDQMATPRAFISHWREVYTGSIGAEFAHIDEPSRREWLQDRLENPEHRHDPPPEQRLAILSSLIRAAVFDELLRTKYVGKKTFSLEGSESLIPLLELAIDHAGRHGVREIVIGMAHRGRLNVLTNIVGKPVAEVFREFEDKDASACVGACDVKQHLGFSADRTTSGGHVVHLALCFNPSHLEFINAVAMGRLRARQDRAGDSRREAGMLLLIHGDAAMAGQGVVPECLNLAALPGYTVGGALHVVVNNQIGFTTTPEEGRSTPYATDVARMIQAPVFHVNGHDPDAVAFAVLVAMEFRREFNRDVFIDLCAYRTHGHNEVDDPSFTQPLLYRLIDKQPPVRQSYAERLCGLRLITPDDADRVAEQYRAALEEALAAVRGESDPPPPVGPASFWSGYSGGREETAPAEPETGVAVARLADLLKRSTEVPEAFRRHPTLERLSGRRVEMADGSRPLDWSAAEFLALATLAQEGVRIRLAGQDTQRGTFGHRHAVLHDYETGATFTPLQNIGDGQAAVDVLNSPLSEIAALGFEYGYSLDYPEALVMWEAQFGDFFNAAQVILDQFITSAEDKWRRLSGIVLLLPHGFEGQGPEHSSARIERFLALAAEDNIQIAQPSTPAQLFHLLRRQALRSWRKPLIVFTPKSLLRHPAAGSRLDELSRGMYQRVIHDERADPAAVTRVILCSGKIYYELSAAGDAGRRDDVALIRLEQFYPLRAAELESALEPFREGAAVCWVQEEPANMGARTYLRSRFDDVLCGRFRLTYLSRPESASPATGSSAAHKLEQEDLVRRALGGVGGG